MASPVTMLMDCMEVSYTTIPFYLSYMPLQYALVTSSKYTLRTLLRTAYPHAPSPPIPPVTPYLSRLSPLTSHIGHPLLLSPVPPQ